MKSFQHFYLSFYLSLASAFLCAAPQAAQLAQTGIHPWLGRGDQLNATLKVDGKVVCQINNEVAAHDSMRREPSCAFTMPPSAKNAILSGTLTRSGAAKPMAFSKQWHLVDAAPYTQALYDGNASLSQRWLNWSAQLEKIQKKYPDNDFPLAGVKPDPALPAALAAAEQRLGMPLPAALKEILRLGPALKDSFFHKPQSLVSVEKLLISEWGSPALEKIVPAATLARYRRSVAVFTEVGDGLGALAFDPQGVRPGEPSHAWGDGHGAGAQPSQPQRGVWFWLHEETIGEPTLLLNQQRQAVSDEQALLTVFQRLVLDRMLSAVAEAGLVPAVDDEKTIWVDSAHPNALLQLHFDDKKPKLWLRSYDRFYSLLGL